MKSALVEQMKKSSHPNFYGNVGFQAKLKISGLQDDVGLACQELHKATRKHGVFPKSSIM
jgi:hypothetical protein